MDVVDDLMKANTCIKQPVEIYSKKYYTSQVKPDLDSTDTNISMLRQQIKTKFKVESKEIQDEVMCIHEEQITNKNSAIVVKDDEETYLDIGVEARQRVFFFFFLLIIVHRGVLLHIALYYRQGVDC